MVRTPPRSATLAHRVLGTIVRGDIAPGDPIDLPALGRSNGVSRTVVREALADLGGKGLVRARPRVGTTVAPQDHWHLLDPDLMAAVAAGPGCTTLRAEAAALRRVIEPALAAEAARDAQRGQRSAVLAAVRELAGALGAANTAAFALADARLHGAIADACANRLLRAIDRALVPIRALHRQRLLATAADDPQAGGARLRRMLVLQTGLALAIARGEHAAASNWAVELAGLGVTDDAPGPALAPVPAGCPADPPAEVQDRPGSAEPDDWPHTVTATWPDTVTAIRPYAHPAETRARPPEPAAAARPTPRDPALAKTGPGLHGPARRAMPATR